MKYIGLIALVALMFAGTATVTAENDYLIWQRGDVDGDTDVDMGDVVFLMNWIQDYTHADPPCMNQTDINDDGYAADYADVMFLIQFLIYDGYPPPAPGPYADQCSLNTYAHGCETLDCPGD